MTPLTDQQISFVAGRIQNELDRRLNTLREHSRELPFDGTRVVKFITVLDIVADSFTYTLMQRMKETPKED